MLKWDRRVVRARRQETTMPPSVTPDGGLSMAGGGDRPGGRQPMKSDRSRSSAALGLAPTIDLTNSPLEKTDIVGIDMIW